MATTETTSSSDQAPVQAGLPAVLADPSGGVPARQPTQDELPEVGKVKRAWRWWLGKAAIIGAKQNKVFAWLAFWLGLTPVGVFMRRGDRLDRTPRPIGDSEWKDRTDPIHTDPRRARRPF
jgi:hypothetical protein